MLLLSSCSDFFYVILFHNFFYFCGRVPWLYQYWPGGFMLFVVLVLKRLRRRGNGLKSHPTDWEKPEYY